MSGVWEYPLRKLKLTWELAYRVADTVLLAVSLSILLVTKAFARVLNAVFTAVRKANDEADAADLRYHGFEPDDPREDRGNRIN